MAVESRSAGAVFLNCPRCGLSVRRRFESLMLEHCPRCIGRAGISVRMFVTERPAIQWHRDRSASPIEEDST